MSEDGCGKQAYSSRKKALKALMRTGGKREGKAERRVYWCPQCSAWHLTSWSLSAGAIHWRLKRSQS